MTRTLRMRVLFGFTLGASLLGVTSAAFACTHWRGYAQLSDGTRTVSATGNGIPPNTYCAKPSSRSSTWPRAIEGGVVTFSASAVTQGGCQYSLNDLGVFSDYKFSLNKGVWDPNHGSTPTCTLAGSDRQPTTVMLNGGASYTPQPNGSVPPTAVTITGTTGPGTYQFCLSRDGFGNSQSPQLPFTVL